MAYTSDSDYEDTDTPATPIRVDPDSVTTTSLQSLQSLSHIQANNNPLSPFRKQQLVKVSLRLKQVFQASISARLNLSQWQVTRSTLENPTLSLPAVSNFLERNGHLVRVRRQIMGKLESVEDDSLASQPHKCCYARMRECMKEGKCIKCAYERHLRVKL